MGGTLKSTTLKYDESVVYISVIEHTKTLSKVTRLQGMKQNDPQQPNHGVSNVFYTFP